MSFAAHSAETAQDREDRRARKDGATTEGSIDGGHLKSFIERIERREEEKKAIADDIKEVYAEAKANGYDTKIMRKIVALRKQDVNKRREEEEILDLYLSALGEG